MSVQAPKDLTRVKQKAVEPEVVKEEVSRPAYRWEREKERDSRMVTGKFQCHEPRGGSVKFSFKQYKGDPVKTYEFHDGQTYTIPLGVAKHLNNNCNYPVYSEILGPDGLRTSDITKRVQRFNFIQPFDDGELLR